MSRASGQKETEANPGRFAALIFDGVSEPER
jgi:hypothetical protein